MSFSPLLTELINALQLMPGIGQRSAQRITFSLLNKNRANAQKIVACLDAAVSRMRHCQYCRMLSEQPICAICQDARRDRSCLCVVETAIDVLTLEKGAIFRGRYFVLGGHLSPIDGIGPSDIGIDQLLQRVESEEQIKEIILATNSTVEGEATTHYLTNQLKLHNVRISRIAYGVPLGGELEYMDDGTLLHAFESRQEMK